MAKKADNYQDWLIETIYTVIKESQLEGTSIDGLKSLAQQLNRRGYTNKRGREFSEKTLQKFFSRLGTNRDAIEHLQSLEPNERVIDREMKVVSFSDRIADLIDLNKSKTKRVTKEEPDSTEDEIDQEFHKKMEWFLQNHNK